MTWKSMSRIANGLLLLLVVFSTTQAIGESNKAITGGYVLTHEHPTNPMAFGGNYAFTGTGGNYPDGVMLQGYTRMAPGCADPTGTLCNYGKFRGLLAGELALGGDMGVHEPHWGPKQNAFAHARYSTEWIKELWNPPDKKYRDTRLKILVAFTVESYSMCETLYYVNRVNVSDGYPCVRGDSLKSNERQIAALKNWATENSDWMEIAYTPEAARRIANEGKLVVILGIESDYDFGAEDRRFDPVQRLKKYHSMGIRTFYLAHKINSRLSGADVFSPGHTLAGKAIRANQALAGCFFYDDSIANFPLKNSQGHNFCNNNCGDGAFKGNKLFGLLDSCSFKPSDISEFNTTDYIATRGNGSFNGFRIYPQTPGFSGPGGSHEDNSTHAPVIVERNNLGLSHDGERVVRAAMRRGMIVNIDHVSSQGRIDMRTISRNFGNYPLNGLHNNPNGILKPNKNALTSKRYLHEYNFDDNELDMIGETGGFFGVRVGPIDAKLQEDSGVTIDCPETITETAQVLAYLLKRNISVGYSLDYATVTKGVYSRTAKGNAPCANLAEDHLHTYLDRKSNRTFTTRGLAHAGVMQKWHQELQAIGLNQNYLKTLRNDGPEQFIRMWERAHRKKRVGNQIPRQTFTYNPPPDVGCTGDSQCAGGEFCSRGVIAGLAPSQCMDKRDKGGLCSEGRHCTSGRCGAGFCAKAHQCNQNTDCQAGAYCKTPLGIAEARICAIKLSTGQKCSKDSACITGRCGAGFCAVAHQCTFDSDCGNGNYCKTPIGIAEARVCKTKLNQGTLCTSDHQCSTNRCAWGACRDADECQFDSDCGSGQHCGDPISGKRTCKAKLALGKLCTKSSQCSSACCKPHISAGGLPICRPASKC